MVLHVLNYSYRDSVSETANYGSPAKAIEKALNRCNYALPIANWTSTSLLIAVQERFPEVKGFCELPFTRL